MFVTWRCWHSCGTLTDIPFGKVGSPGCGLLVGYRRAQGIVLLVDGGDRVGWGGVVGVVMVVMAVLIWRRGARSSRPATCCRDADGRRWWAVGVAPVAVVAWRWTLAGGTGPTAVDFHVFPQRARMRVALVAPWHAAVVWLVRSVNVWMLLPVWAVRKPPVAALELTFERLLACNRNNTSPSSIDRFFGYLSSLFMQSPHKVHKINAHWGNHVRPSAFPLVVHHV